MVAHLPRYGKRNMQNYILIGREFKRVQKFFKIKIFVFSTINYSLELHSESGNNKPELIFMDQIEDISSDFVPYKGEQCIQIRVNDGSRDGRILLTNSVSNCYFKKVKVKSNLNIYIYLQRMRLV